MYFRSSGFLRFLLDKLVRINRGGPESRQGRLVAVKDDHLVLLTEETEYLYYQTHQVKSVTVNSMDSAAATVERVKAPPYLNADNFRDILSRLQYRWVQINRGGHESVEGVLCRLLPDHIDLVHGHEIIKVPTFHINNISFGAAKQAAGSPAGTADDKATETQTGSATHAEPSDEGSTIKQASAEQPAETQKANTRKAKKRKVEMSKVPMTPAAQLAEPPAASNAVTDNVLVVEAPSPVPAASEHEAALNTPEDSQPSSSSNDKAPHFIRKRTDRLKRLRRQRTIRRIVKIKTRTVCGCSTVIKLSGASRKTARSAGRANPALSWLAAFVRVRLAR
jgi:spore coat protein B